MPYEFHIVRTRSWLDSESDPIDQLEWEAAADNEPRLIDAGTVDWLDMPSQRIYVWREDGPSLSWREGQVTVTGLRSPEVGAEMAAFAHAMGARLIGDWDEEIDERGEAHPLEIPAAPPKPKRSFLARLLRL